MAKDQTRSEFTNAFLARVRRLRLEMKHPNGKQWTAADMATALGIEADTYRKYETRTPLPHELMPRFALITGVTVEHLLTGSSSTREARARQSVQANDSVNSSSTEAMRTSK
jgi:hypothetical protein